MDSNQQKLVKVLLKMFIHEKKNYISITNDIWDQIYNLHFNRSPNYNEKLSLFLISNVFIFEHIYNTEKETYTIMFKLELKLCKYHQKKEGCSNKNCKDLHLCKFFLSGTCNNLKCSFSHDLRTHQNLSVLKKYYLEDFNPKDIKFFLQVKGPKICIFYNMNNSCKYGKEGNKCSALHVCRKYAINDDCTDACTLSHNVESKQVIGVLVKYGLNVSNSSSKSITEKIKLLEIENDEDSKEDLDEIKRDIQICQFYNNENGCLFPNKCYNLHLCQYYLWNECKFTNKCKRSHNIEDIHNQNVLIKHGKPLDESIFKDLKVLTEIDTFVFLSIKTENDSSKTIVAMLTIEMEDIDDLNSLNEPLSEALFDNKLKISIETELYERCIQKKLNHKQYLQNKVTIIGLFLERNGKSVSLVSYCEEDVKKLKQIFTKNNCSQFINLHLNYVNLDTMSKDEDDFISLLGEISYLQKDDVWEPEQIVLSMAKSFIENKNSVNFVCRNSKKIKFLN